MSRLAFLLTAATALTPVLTADAIKVTLSGEIDLGVNYPDVTEYNPTADVASDLNFDVVHEVSPDTRVGGNLDLNVGFSYAGGTDPDVSLDEANVFVDSAPGKITFTTDGTLDNADAYLSVADEVTGESGDYSLLFESPDLNGFSSAVVFDVLGGDASGSLVYSDSVLEANLDIEQIGQNLFIDTEFELIYGEFTGKFYGAVGGDGSEVEVEGAAKLSYDFGTATVFAGASTYTELAAGVDFEVDGLTVGFDISGMPNGVTASSNSILTTTSTVEDTVTFGLSAEYKFEDHLTIEGDFDTSTVADVNTSTASFGVKLEF